MKYCEVKNIGKKEGLNQKFSLSFEFNCEYYAKSTLYELKDFKEKTTKCSTVDLLEGIIDAIENDN